MPVTRRLPLYYSISDNKNRMKLYSLLGFALLLAGQSAGQKVTTRPTFQVKFAGPSVMSTPTADKPQSKLWFMDSCWWVLLPDSVGPTLWQRTDKGWKERTEVSKRLKGKPGRADVWYENRVVTAVGVSADGLYIYRLTPGRSSSANWRARVLSRLNIPRENPEIETATIVRDAAGLWWVAADAGGGTVYVWSSEDAIHWSDGLLIGEGMAEDDICSISALKESVIVIWSDQKREAVYCREHINGQPAGNWSGIRVIEAGNKTADDHINTALSADGTLWVNTKNEVDSAGFPNLVLRVLAPGGEWRNFPYQQLDQEAGPSRPVVITTNHPDVVLGGYTVYDRKNKKRYADRIRFGIIDTTSADILVKQTDVIVPDTSLQIMINNITGPKAAFPSGGPWIILASDRKGNIYEADLKPFFDKPR